MGNKRSRYTHTTYLNHAPATPFLVESFVWAFTKPFESWYVQRKRYADCGASVEIIRQATGQQSQSRTRRT